MIPTQAVADQFEEAEWTAPPEVQHCLEFEVALLVAIPAKGVLSDLERCYQLYKNRNQRNDAVDRIVFKRFKDRFPDEWVFFSADCPDNGACRFQMRVAKRQEDVRFAPAARLDHDLNFMKLHEDWVVPPVKSNGHEIAPQPRAQARTNQPASSQSASHAPKPPAKPVRPKSTFKAPKT